MAWRKLFIQKTRVKTFIFKLHDRRLHAALVSWVELTHKKHFEARRVAIVEQSRKERMLSVILVTWRALARAKAFESGTLSANSIGTSMMRDFESLEPHEDTADSKVVREFLV